MQPAEADRDHAAELEAHRQLVGELAEQLAHDLANRLAVARLTAEVLANRPDLPADLADRVATVVTATSEAGELVQQLSAVAGRRSAPPHRLDLGRTVAELAPLLRAGLGRRPLDVVAEPALVLADRRDIEEIVLRMVLGGGRVADAVTLSVSTEADHATVAVRRTDDLSARALTRIAELAALTGGSLSSMELMTGGQEHVVRMASVPAETLDVVAVPAPEGACVLVVEDDTDLRDLVRGALEADGYSVDAVPDAAAALAHPTVVGGRLDLLVTDVELPGMSGLELAAKLSAAGVRVLVMSGHGEAALEDDLPEGALVLDKPFGVPDLRARAREALGH
ncbi:MAG: ATP-binding region ATPase domain protein [Acidimicrobiales bacterium]|nr:ATP-binding region ATPase domain protein [Acidimicrobiales bacterium]